MGQHSVEMSHTQMSCSSLSSVPPPTEELLEGVSKLWTEDSVDDWIEG